ncbi:MAG: hypothetical protein ABW277_08290 [Longimicrobiaceae bacterium]
MQALLTAAFAAHGWMPGSPPPELLSIMNEQIAPEGTRTFMDDLPSPEDVMRHLGE